MSNNYTLGRGEVHFGQYATGTTVPRGERYFGNTPDLGFTAEQQNLDHFSADRGVKIKDESVLLELNYSGTLVTDNISFDNLAAFFLGEALTTTTASATGVAYSFSGAEQGATYQLGTSDALPAGTRDITSFVVTTPAGAVAGVDYVVDLALARVTVLEGSTVLTEGITFSGTYNQNATTRDRVISRSTTVEGALRFIAANPAGQNIDYYMPWVKLTPNGDYQLKGDQWQQLSFKMEILKKGTLEPIYMDGRAYTP